jgi:hypothetical protein
MFGLALPAVHIQGPCSPLLRGSKKIGLPGLPRKAEKSLSSPRPYGGPLPVFFAAVGPVFKATMASPLQTPDRLQGQTSPASGCRLGCGLCTPSTSISCMQRTTFPLLCQHGILARSCHCGRASGVWKGRALLGAAWRRLRLLSPTTCWIRLRDRWTISAISSPKHPYACRQYDLSSAFAVEGMIGRDVDQANMLLTDRSRSEGATSDGLRDPMGLGHGTSGNLRFRK